MSALLTTISLGMSSRSVLMNLIFFYSLLAQREYVQCHALAENGELDDLLLQQTFAAMASLIRRDRQYQPGANNQFTFVISPGGIRIDVRYYGEDMRTYQVKKGWKQRYIEA